MIPSLTVSLSNKTNGLKGFKTGVRLSEQPAERLLTFTGIQVLEPRVLDYIPENTASSSIDAFKKILADDKKLQAYIAPKGKWQDIGTPERYRQTAYATVSLPGFQKGFRRYSRSSNRKEKA